MPREKSPGLEFISAERRESEYQGAIKHANRVRRLKIILPVIGGVIIFGFALALLVRQFFLPDIDLGSVTLKDGKLVMENPSLNGFDKDKRPYSLSADKAIQDADRPRVVELVKINATLPVDENTSAQIRAGHGVYDAEAKTLILSRQVFVETSDGMKVDLEDADIDIGQGNLDTSNPVFASSRQADISANSLQIRQGGEHLVFDGAVEMILRPKELKKPGNSNE